MGGYCDSHLLYCGAVLLSRGRLVVTTLDVYTGIHGSTVCRLSGILVVRNTSYFFYRKTTDV